MSISSSGRCTSDVADVVPAPSDTAVDSLGKFVAVAGENGKVAVADLAANARVVTSFDAHSGVISRVCWAHHRFGRVLATSALDGEVAVWGAKQNEGDAPASYERAYVHRVEGGCNGIAWAPQEYGAMIAIAGGDGHVTILNARDATMSQWDSQTLRTHGGGCHAVSWSPSVAPGTLIQLPLAVPQQQQQQQPAVTMPSPRLVTCGPERSVRIWRYLAQDRHWLQEQELADLPPEVSLVRDVAWAPNPGLPFGYVAAGSEEGYVCVWLQDGTDGRWHASPLSARFPAPVCRVGWSAAGTLLHVNCADGASSVWRESPDGSWACMFTTQR